MNIHFTYQDRAVDIPCSVGGTLKLYDVPTDYSEDGFYAAIIRPGDIEPYPACAGDQAHILADLDIDSEGILTCKRLELGVTYAAD